MLSKFSSAITTRNRENCGQRYPGIQSRHYKKQCKRKSNCFSRSNYLLLKKISPYSREFKKLTDVNYYREGNFYKYTIGEENSFEKIEALRKKFRIKISACLHHCFQRRTKNNGWRCAEKQTKLVAVISSFLLKKHKPFFSED